jgi:hypothetical protein
MTGWRKRQVTDMARESWLDVYGLGHDRQSFVKALEAFEELVREEATAEANARANASWTLMCEKMVAVEREACAKVCDDALTKIWEYHSAEVKSAAGNVCTNLATAIRARGNHD